MKNYKLKKEDIKILIDSKEGCIATDRITVDGAKIGYMYREEPSEKYPDSGWRFLAGDESQEYLDNHENSEVYLLNTICNYDLDIIPYLDAEIGSAFYRNKRGKFVPDQED